MWFPIVLAVAFSSQQALHPFTVHDLLAMDRISDLKVSPDGGRILFSLRETDLDANRGRPDIWMVNVDGTGLRQLTTHEASDSDARWLPDGSRIVFLSTRSGSSQVWELPLAGGEARQLSRLPLGVSNLGVFPDGERVFFTIEVYPDAASLEETSRRDREKESDPVKARLYEQLLFRHWDTWEDGKRSHVFVWPIDGSAEPLDLMKGWDADSPTRPFGGAEEIAVSPEGDEIVFAAKKVGSEAAWSTNVDLWSVPADGSSAPRLLTGDNDAYDNHPAFSPDGRFLAWTAMSRPGFEADRTRVVLLDRRSGARRVLTENWDRSAGTLLWSRDGKTLYTSAPHIGNTSLFAIDVETGGVRTLVDKGTNDGAALAGSRIVFLQDTLSQPAEIRSITADGSDSKAVTRVNEEKIRAIRWGEYEQFSFSGHAGETVYGFVMKPADFVEGRKYPVAFIIHGGPQGSMGDHFHYRWNPQVYAGAGYASVFIDFHGSIGYGQDFTDSISGDWGGKPYEDLVKGLDHALAMYPFLDGSRACALGASYGGYMINWIAGQTDRFRCLVNHDGVFDTRMFYFDTEELWFPEWEHDGPAFQNPEAFERFNPALRVARWKTPMLVIQGARDFRVVETQALSAFTALKRRGIPSKLLHFPDENHWVLKPRNSILWHETVLDWLSKWTEGS